MPIPDSTMTPTHPPVNVFPLFNLTPGLSWGSWSFPSSLHLYTTPHHSHSYSLPPFWTGSAMLVRDISTREHYGAQPVCSVYTNLTISPTPEFLNVIFLFCLHSLYERNFCLILHDDFSLALSPSLERYPAALHPWIRLGASLIPFCLSLPSTSFSQALYTRFTISCRSELETVTTSLVLRQRAEPHSGSLLC